MSGWDLAQDSTQYRLRNAVFQEKLFLSGWKQKVVEMLKLAVERKHIKFFKKICFQVVENKKLFKILNSAIENKKVEFSSWK